MKPHIRSLAACFALQLSISAIPAFALASSGNSGGSPSSAQQSSVDKRDVQMLNKLAKGSSAEISLGRDVQAQATTPSVKEFAQRMVSDHRALLADATKWAADHSVPFNASPEKEDKMAHHSVAGLSGKELEKKYIESMLRDHKKDVAEVAKYLSEHPNSSIAPMLKKALPVLENHMRIAQNVAGQIGVKADAGLIDAGDMKKSTA